MTLPAPFTTTWRTFLIELELARNYPMAYQLDHQGVAVRNPVLEKILPSLLHIKMATLLALDAYLTSTGTVLPKNYQPTLGGRIFFFTDSAVFPTVPRFVKCMGGETRSCMNRHRRYRGVS